MDYLLECECGKKYPGDLPQCPKCGSEFATPATLNHLDYVYDIESFPNVFTCTFIHPATDSCWVFEISDRKNELEGLVQFLLHLQHISAAMIGFNSVGYDYVVIHEILKVPGITYFEIYQKSISIINSNDRFQNTIWTNKHYVKQTDLFKIHHFDNVARSTSLKSLEFNMRMKSVEDMPFKFGIDLNDAQKDILIKYNIHDVKATVFFYVRSLDLIAFRAELSAKYNRDFTNHNDTKIGKDFFIMELENNGIPCKERGGDGKMHPLQTLRPTINLNDAVLPYIHFERPEFESIKRRFQGLSITETKGTFKDMNCSVDGLQYDFGTGGLHASVHGQDIHSNETHQIVDVDVASYYPNLAIVNKFYPEHLGEYFCKIYKDVYDQRKSYAKGTPENAMLKLALNGVYGDSNNKYSPFYDPLYTMKITINGQLLLCVLAEQLIKIPGLSIIQCNTDGVSFLCPREYMEHQRNVCKWWEDFTKLELEEALYSRMMIRDVNNYMAQYENGKIKRIGAYAHETAEQNPTTREVLYNKDWSSLVVPKAAQAAIVDGVDVRAFIENHVDDYDFMLRVKVPRSNNLFMRWSAFDTEMELPGTCRMYVSKNGGDVVKVAPPTGVLGSWKRKPKLPDSFYNQCLAEKLGDELDSVGAPWDARIHTGNKSKHSIREFSICKSWKMTECNKLDSFDRSNVDYEYYIQEAQKLIDPIINQRIQ